MSCVRELAKKNHAELVSLFGNENTATALISLNNGYPLTMTRNGVRSTLFDDIMLVTKDRRRALAYKSLIYASKFDAERSDSI